MRAVCSTTEEISPAPVRSHPRDTVRACSTNTESIADGYLRSEDLHVPESTHSDGVWYRRKGRPRATDRLAHGLHAHDVTPGRVDAPR